MNRIEGNGTRKKLQQYSYSLKQNIGKGYSSQVFRGRNDETNKQVAIKVIDMRMIKGEVHKNLLSSQIDVLKILKNCNNIIEMYEIYNSKNNTYIITELCQGGDLSHMINSRKIIPESQAIHIMQQILKGYQEIYKQGIIHRDLKPANIFLKNNQIKIADFGFAIKNNDVKKSSSYNVGSPIYMSPQALNDNKYSMKSDIWAIGVIFFQLLTGKTPWKAKTQKQLVKQLLCVPIKKLIPKNISPSINKFLTKTMTVDINERMSPQELINYNLQSQSAIHTQINPINSFITKNNTIKGTHQTHKIFMKAEQELSLARNNKGKKLNTKCWLINEESKNISLPKTDSTINKTDHLISPKGNQQMKPTNFTQKNIAQQKSMSGKFLKYQSIKNTTTYDKQQDQINKVQKQVLSKELLTQVHFCRFLYKLIIRLQDKLNADFNEKLQGLKSAMCGMIFQKLQDVLQITNKSTKQCIGVIQLSKIVKIVHQYQQKYSKQLQNLSKQKLSTNQMKDLLKDEILTIYKSLINNQGIQSIKQEIIVLDYLVTLRQLIGLQQNYDLEGFHRKSKMETIVEGVPSNHITQAHLNAITNKLKAIKIIN